MRWFHWLLGLVLVGGLGAYGYMQSRLNSPLISESDIERLRAEVATYNDVGPDRPVTATHEALPASATRNVFFGDLHVHTSLSFDSYIFANRFDVDQAYRIAKGERVESLYGEVIQLARPLDFAAITDHAEGFGMHELCAHSDLSAKARKYCDGFEEPRAKMFLQLREEGEKRPPQSPFMSFEPEEGAIALAAQQTWASVVDAAARNNDPGRFTAFAAYEYSPPLPDSGKIHRNVIFRGDDVPVHAPSAFDALTELDLWQQLNQGCAAPCEYLTIPHNPNKSWGLAFANHTIDGDVYSTEDWKTRRDREPLVEMFQIKGNSECVIGFGATDEECAVEQFFPVCEEGQETSCIFETSMARDGLKKGLRLEEELGFNPLAFGMIGSTDTHVSNPGDTEEWDYAGSIMAFGGPASRRVREGQSGNRAAFMRNPGGLAAIWAVENTRDALFDAMQRKEVYGTSGTRIKLRFFGSGSFEPDFALSAESLASAYEVGVSMGGHLKDLSGAPTFVLEAEQDELSAPLDRVQIIKAWTENGATHERVLDIACSNDRVADAQSGRCETLAAPVDLATCDHAPSAGSDRLAATWTDETFEAGQKAFYYARVVEIPTCRWSTWDALRLGREPLPDVPATVTEMAWSSPIWIN